MTSRGPVRIERRAFLSMPAFAAFAAAGEVRRQITGSGTPAKVTFDDFVAETGALAKKLIAEGGRGESEYLYRVAAMGERIDRVPDATMGEPFKGIIRSGLNYRGSGIVVVQWAMDKGLKYPPHNHPNYNGITVGIDGECRFRNFDVVGNAPEMGKDGPFEVRETQSQWMTPGSVVSIMRTDHNNIHTLQTTSHAVRGIDVMTLVGKHIGFSFVEVDDRESNSEGRFRAKWGEYLAR